MLISQEQIVYIHRGITLGIDKIYLFENKLGEIAKILDYKSLSELHQHAKTNFNK